MLALLFLFWGIGMAKSEVQSEHDEQVRLIEWWALSHNQFGVPEQLLFAIPNGGVRNIVTATKLKAEGVRAGIPDLFLAVPRGESHGMFIEMKKTKGGRVSEAQSNTISLLHDQKFIATVCHGWEDAMDAIIRYLNS